MVRPRHSDPGTRGEFTTELTVRTVAKPDRRVAELLYRLGLELPTRNRIVEPPEFPSARTNL